MVLVTCFGVSLLKIQVWDAMPCWLVCSCWHYEVRQCLLLQGQGIQKEWHILDCLTLEMKHYTLSKHEKLFTKSTQCSTTEDSNLYHNCCENIIPHRSFSFHLYLTYFIQPYCWIGLQYFRFFVHKVVNRLHLISCRHLFHFIHIFIVDKIKYITAQYVTHERITAKVLIQMYYKYNLPFYMNEFKSMVVGSLTSIWIFGF